MTYLRMQRPHVARDRWLRAQIAKADELLQNRELSDDDHALVLLIYTEFRQDLAALSKEVDDVQCC